MNFKYSIIIPCYNEEKYIINLLSSLQRLSFDKNDFEVIVSLNNCVDNTELLVREFNEINSLNIKVINEPKVGVSYARNSGAENSNGDYLIFIDADIVVDEMFLENLDHAISKKKSAAGTFRTLPDRFDVKGYLFFSLLEFIKLLRIKPFGKGYIKRDIFNRIAGFDTSIELGENVDFLVKAKSLCKKQNLKFIHINQAIYCSLRRFDHEGYMAIAIPWMFAYLGAKNLKYKTFSEINNEKPNKLNYNFRLPFFRYMNSYMIYPLVERFLKREILTKVDVLSEFNTLSREAMVTATKKKMYDICKNASLYVPYYRELFSDIGFEPESILEDIKNLDKIPYLTKEIVRSQGKNLIDERVLNNENEVLHERKTGGSTGVSTLIYYNQETLDWTAASNLHALSWVGKKRHLYEIHLSSFFPEKFPFVDRFKEAVKCLSLNRYNIVTHSFNDSDLDQVVNKIKSKKVFYLEGHPSTLYAIAEYIERNNIVLKKPLFNVFGSTGELLDIKKRTAIEKYIGCKVFNRYGSAEFGVIAHETEDSSYTLKVLESMVFPEIFKDNLSDYTHSLIIDENGYISNSLTIKMIKIWKSRADLQNIFPYALTAQRFEFWRWWVQCARSEYSVENVIPAQILENNINPSSKLKFLTEIVWKSSSDLLNRFNLSLDSDLFLAWWDNIGKNEFFQSVPTDENINELVLTTLSNYAMPLIRYRTGDLIGELIENVDGKYIKDIQGRIHDLVVIGDKKYPTHYIQDLLDRLGGVIEFQVQETKTNSIILYLVVPDLIARENVKKQLNLWWGDSVKVEFIDLSDIKRIGWRDKFRYVLPVEEKIDV